jgi:chromosome segregation ATPase
VEQDWGTNPMLKQLSSIKDSLIAGHELRQRVQRLEATIATMQSILNEREAERIDLRTRVKVAEDEAKAAMSEMEQLRANLDYEKQLFVTLNHEHDELQAAHKALMEDYGKAKDERDEAVSDRQLSESSLAGLEQEHKRLDNEFTNSRAVWFKQEDDLQRAVRDLTAERNSFEEKFRKCKSFAASIMALDQVKPEAIEPQYN